ncbi:hypothetical protein GEMRC1_008470 [Eukaryota sp. GEM-RC1]
MLHSHEEIVHYIPYVCSVESNIFNVFLIIGNQSSNVFQLHLSAPRHDFFPLVLSPSGNILRLFGASFGKMFECFANSSIQMSGHSSQLQAIRRDELLIFTGNLVGLKQFITQIEFTTDISILLAIPITTLEAYNTSFVCFINHLCEIEVYSLYGEVSMYEYQITQNIPNFMEILDFQPSHSLAYIKFISNLPGCPDDLELCNESGCYPIFNLPFVVSPSSISPQFIQWFGSSVFQEISLNIEGIQFYEFTTVERSFGYEHSFFHLSRIHYDVAVFDVNVTSTGLIATLGQSFSSIFNLNLPLEIGNFVLIPPLVQFNSRIEFILLRQISNIFISHGGQSMLVNLGSNVIELYDDQPYLSLHQSLKSINVSVITDLMDSQLPSYYEVSALHSFTIDFNHIDYLITVECLANCEILDQSSYSGTLNVTFLSLNQGESSFEFFVEYLETSFSFEIGRQVVLPPAMSFTSPLMFSTIDDVIIRISVLSQCALFSQFLLNNSIIVHDHVDLTFSEFDVFPYTYSYSFNISSFSFIVGESDLELTWKNIGFQSQSIGNIKIFNTDLVSSVHVSVYEHRDILAEFSGILFSQLYCVVSGYSFTASITSSSLICRDLIISTFQENVLVDVYFETLLVNSFTVCFLPQSHHPSIHNSLFFANISNNLIFDGSRCCNVDVSFCSEFLSFNDAILIKFNFTFDLFKIIITTNSSCQGSDFDLPFSLIVNNQSITPSFSCKQIPSGFAFALMCEIDVVIPAISELILVCKSDLFLIELEFYGYESNFCVTPVDINKGLTALGEEIEAEIHLQMDNEKYTFEQFKNGISQSSNYIAASQLSFTLFLVSSNCVQSMVPFTITFTPSNPVKLIFVGNYIEIDGSYLNISIPIFCVDSIGFIVECTGNLSVLNSSFNYTSFELSASSLSFSTLSSFSYSNHYVELEFNEQYFKTNISVVQKFAEILVVESSFIFDYSEDMLFDKSCTVLRLFVSLITQHHFLNISESNDISQLSFVTTNDQVVLSVVNDVLEIISYPRQSVLITLSYLSQSITLNLITNDCRLPKLNSQQRCLCPKGMEFNFFGECVECPLNYYSNSEFNSECRSCPFPRVTLQKVLMILTNVFVL